MRTVNIGISHNDNFAVTEFGKVYFVTDTAAESSYDGHQFIIAIDTVKTCFFDIEHFAPKRENSLKTSVTPTFCRAACRVALNYVNFGFLHISGLAVGKLSGKSCTLHSGFSSGKVTGFSCSVTGFCSHESFFENGFCGCGIFFKVLFKFFADKLINECTDRSIAEFGFCLTFELGFFKLYADNGSKTFTNIFTA